MREINNYIYFENISRIINILAIYILFCMGDTYCSLLIYQHPRVTLFQGEQAVPFQLVLRFPLGTEPYGVVKRFVSEEIPFQMMNSLVETIFRHVYDCQTIGRHFRLEWTRREFSAQTEKSNVHTRIAPLDAKDAAASYHEKSFIY